MSNKPRRITVEGILYLYSVGPWDTDSETGDGATVGIYNKTTGKYTRVSPYAAAITPSLVESIIREKQL